MTAIAEALFLENPCKALRSDVLSNLITIASVTHAARPLVWDGYKGLLFGAVRQRAPATEMFFIGERAKKYPYSSYYNVKDPIELVNDPQPFYDSLIVATKRLDLDRIGELIKLVRGSGDIAIHSYSIEDLQKACKKFVEVIDIHLEEIFTREY